MNYRKAKVLIELSKRAVLMISRESFKGLMQLIEKSESTAAIENTGYIRGLKRADDLLAKQVENCFSRTRALELDQRYDSYYYMQAGHTAGMQEAEAVIREAIKYGIENKK